MSDIRNQARWYMTDGAASEAGADEMLNDFAAEVLREAADALSVLAAGIPPHGLCPEISTAKCAIVRLRRRADAIERGEQQ